jgi:hypothetical protein
MIPSNLPKFIPNMSALWITPFSLTPVSNRNELLVPSSDLKIVINQNQIHKSELRRFSWLERWIEEDSKYLNWLEDWLHYDKSNLVLT